MARPEESSNYGNSRFYEKEFPDVEECVMVTVKRIAEMGAYVQVRVNDKHIIDTWGNIQKNKSHHPLDGKLYELCRHHFSMLYIMKLLDCNC